jgi:DNA replication protein DnaC
MLNEQTVNKLHEMRLSGMVDAFRQQQKDNAYSEMTFEERFGLIVDNEWLRRKNSHLRRLLRNAGFHSPEAAVEDINYLPDRHLDKEQITRLSTCQYIAQAHNIILLGATGAGKTYMSCAFGNAACRMFYKVKYIRLPDLFIELAVARGEGNYKKVMKTYQGVNLLILDEWLLTPLTQSETRDVLEIVESRHKRGSTIFSSQFAPGGWHEKIGNDTLADAILDRIVHDSYTIFIDGKDSMRKLKGIQAE